MLNHMLSFSCLDNADSITVFDGRSSLSPIITRLCNNIKYVHVISTGPDLYIEFVSGPQSKNFNLFQQKAHLAAQGFRANYQFIQTANYGPTVGTVISNELTINGDASSSELLASQIPGTGN